MWWQVLFWALLVPCLIVLGIVYGTSRKLYRLFQILATFTYVILVAYVIDVFSLGRNWILGLLVLSAVLMLLLGYRMARKPAKRRKPSSANLVALAVLVAVMLLLIVLGALRLGTTRDVAAVPSLTRAALWTNASAYPSEPSVPVANITYADGSFLPYVVPDQYFAACFRDAQGGYAPEDLSVFIDGQNVYPGDSAFEEVMPGETVTRHLSVVQRLRPVEKGDPGQNPFTGYEALVVVASDRPVSCSSLESMRGRLSLDLTIPLTG